MGFHWITQLQDKNQSGAPPVKCLSVYTDQRQTYRIFDLLGYTSNQNGDEFEIRWNIQYSCNML